MNRVIQLRLQVPDAVPDSDHELLGRMIDMVDHQFRDQRGVTVTISAMEILPYHPDPMPVLSGDVSGLIAALRESLPKQESWRDKPASGELE